MKIGKTYQKKNKIIKVKLLIQFIGLIILFAFKTF